MIGSSFAMLPVLLSVRSAGAAYASFRKYMHLLYHIRGNCFIIICVHAIVYAAGCMFRTRGRVLNFFHIRRIAAAIQLF